MAGAVEQLIGGIRAEREALLEVIAGLDAADLERPGTVGLWSLKDVLAHLAGWQDWKLQVYPYRLKHGEMPEALRVTPDNIDDWNRRFVAERREQSPAAVLQELADGLQRLINLAVGLGPARLFAPDPWPQSEGSVAEYLRMYVAAHDREHREEICGALVRG